MINIKWFLLFYSLQASYSQPSGFSTTDFGTRYTSCGIQPTMTAEIGVFPSGVDLPLPDYSGENLFPAEEMSTESFQSGFDTSCYQGTPHTQSQTFPETYSYEGTFMFDKDAGMLMEQTRETTVESMQPKYTEATMSYEGTFQSFHSPECGFLPQRYSSSATTSTAAAQKSFQRPTVFTPPQDIFPHPHQQHSPVGFTDLDQKQAAFQSQGLGETSGLYCRDIAGFQSFDPGFYDNRSLPHTDSGYNIPERSLGAVYRGDPQPQRQHFPRRPSLTIPMPPRTPEG